ncbi:hypothetical protein L1887_07737 [Cichorium endivia]|nr:hypothetical protein L1887_07737 [Cichorium endivia]
MNMEGCKKREIRETRLDFKAFGEAKRRRPSLDLGNGSYVYSKKCYCDVGREGNPYLYYECPESERCKECRDSGRICQYDERYVDDDDIYDGFFCVYPSVYNTRDLERSKSPMGVILEERELVVDRFVDELVLDEAVNDDGSGGCRDEWRWGLRNAVDLSVQEDSNVDVYLPYSILTRFMALWDLLVLLHVVNLLSKAALEPHIEDVYK